MMSTTMTLGALIVAMVATTSSAQKYGDNGDMDLNLAYRYDIGFHNSFAVIAFVTLVLILTVFAVSLGMWFMDPGRDSIIYRMTSTRMKKDQ